MAITDWPNAERPREKLIQQGAARLSDAELLAIFLRTGTKGCNAVELARKLLRHFGSLRSLFNATEAELCTVPGMGPAKYVQLQAILEMAKRALTEDFNEVSLLNSPRAMRDWLQLHLAPLPHEVFFIVLLDSQHRLIHSSELFRGTLTHTSVYPREVVKLALQHNAAAAIFAHNHPGGNTNPSKADRSLTQSLQAALAVVDVSVLDHFIIAPFESPLSFSEQGLL